MKKTKTTFNFVKGFSYVVLSAWAFTTLFSFYWVIINSFKSNKLISRDSFSIVFPGSENFTTAGWRSATRNPNYDLLKGYTNSLIMSGCVIIFVMLIAGLAAFALARYQFKGKGIVDKLIIISMMVPAVSTIIPISQGVSAVKLAMNAGYNHAFALASVIVIQIAGNLSFAIFLLRTYIKDLPIELEEAAYIEGFSVPRIFFNIIIPLAKPCFATVACFTFIWSFNDVFTQLFVIKANQHRGITMIMTAISTLRGVNYTMMCAIITMVVLPVLIVYVFLQKYIIKGLTAGAIKG